MTRLPQIRAAGPADAATVAEFNAAMALESEGVALDRETLRAGVEAALADAGKAFYLLALIDGRPAGQLMVTYEWSDWRNGWIWWIQSVYVRPEHRRGGVFSGLYRHLRGLADARGDVYGLRLYVMRDNAGAKRTYEAVGMVPAQYDMYLTEFQPAG